MCLGLFAATWTTFDQTTSAFLDGSLGMFLLLVIVSSKKKKYGLVATHSVLAKCERHMLAITANLDVDRTIFAEDLSYSHLKRVFILGLKKTVRCQYKSSMKMAKKKKGKHQRRGGRKLTLQRRRNKKEGRQLVHPQP